MGHVSIDCGELRKIFYVKVLGKEKIEINIDFEKARFIPHSIKKHELVRYFFGQLDVSICIRINGVVYCPLCRTGIKFIACGVVSFLQLPHRDYDEDDIEMLAYRGSKTLALAVSSITLKRHLKKEHGINVKAVRRTSIFYVKRNIGNIFPVSEYYGIQVMEYKCPYCKKKFYGLKQFITHLLNEKKHM